MVVSFAIGRPLAMVTSELPTNRVFVDSLLRMCRWHGWTELPSICTAVVPTINVPELILDIRLRKQSQGSQGQSVQQTATAVKVGQCGRCLVGQVLQVLMQGRNQR